MFTRTLASCVGLSAIATRHVVPRTIPFAARMTSRQQFAYYSKDINQDILGRFQPRQQDDPEDVVFINKFGLRSVELNRPSKLNALNGSMVRKILPRLVEWEESDMANVIIIKGAGKAFCAGGDITALATEIKKRGEEASKEASDFFSIEYQLDHYMATYKKPLVAFMDGVTMGGGVGLSVHAPLRIATENTIFAMPETKIGLYPDVGASFFLPRLNGYLGTYLALTSENLRGVNVYYTGLATHYMDSTMLPSLEARLSELRFYDYDTMETRLTQISRTIDEFATGVPRDQFALSGELRSAIDRCFKFDTVKEIIQALEAETGSTHDWAQKVIASLHQRSPLSVNIALRQMRISRNWSIAETFQREAAMSAKCMRAPDFVEGTIKLLLERNKTPANWKPSTLAEVDAAGKQLVDDYFITPKEKLQLLTNRDFREYPHRQFAVPTEAEVKELVKSTELTPEGIRKNLLESRNHRQGISLVVDEILSRHVTADSHGRAKWIKSSTQESAIETPVQELKGEAKL